MVFPCTAKQRLEAFRKTGPIKHKSSEVYGSNLELIEEQSVKFDLKRGRFSSMGLHSWKLHQVNAWIHMCVSGGFDVI